MSELPEGWAWTKVGDVADISSGFGFPERFQGKPTGDFPFAKVRDISYAHRNNRGRLAAADNYVTNTDLLDLKARPAPAGSIAFAKIGEALRLNRRVLLEQDTILDNNCMAVTGDRRAIDTEYLYQFMTTVDLSPFAVATTVPSVRRGDVEGIELPLPPLSEQRRIVAKIYSLTSKSRRARDHLDHIPRLVEKYKQAVLAAAFRGQLAHVRMGDAKPLSAVVSLRTGPFGSVLHKSDYVSNGVPLVNPMHIVGGSIVADRETSVCEEKAHSLAEFRLQSGDVVLARRGVMGRCAVVTSKETGFVCGTGSMIVRPSEAVLPHYLQRYLSSPDVVVALEEGAVGTTMVNLNQSILLRQQIPLPTIEDQREAVKRIDVAFAWIDRLATEATSARRLIDRLDQAVLAKAFRGELVPQDPADEPASVLLQRIGAERGAAPKARRGRKSKVPV